jgi:hypothetical protein
MLGRQMLKDATNLLLALLIGITVGALCGAVILLISTHELVWNNTALHWGLLYGALIGGIGVPVAHLFLLRKVGLRRAFIPALVGSLVGGMLGAIADPFWAMVLGIAGFSTTVVLVARGKLHRWATPRSR